MNESIDIYMLSNTVKRRIRSLLSGLNIVLKNRTCILMKSTIHACNIDEEPCMYYNEQPFIQWYECSNMQHNVEPSKQYKKDMKIIKNSYICVLSWQCIIMNHEWYAQWCIFDEEQWVHYNISLGSDISHICSDDPSQTSTAMASSTSICLNKSQVADIRVLMTHLMTGR